MLKECKILSLILTLTLSSALVYAQSTSVFGIQAGYGTEIGKVLFGGTLEIFVSPKISISPSASFYLPLKKELDSGGEEKVKYWELNGNIHLYLSQNEKAGFYTLLGLNYVHVKVDVPPSNGQDESDSDTGANLGLGVKFGNGDRHPFIEFKYETVAEGQVVFLLGIRF